MKKYTLAIVAVALLSSLALGIGQQPGRERLGQIEESLKADVPRILCLNESFATAGQPSDQAYGKLAANGFRSVLNLRTASEGIDLEKERSLVEKSGMRYINIPVVSGAPQSEQVDDFLKVVKNADNHPMLIHCGSANRVGAFWMIYRVMEQGWTEEKALEEATKIGLTSPGLKTFARNYVASHKQK